VALDRARRDSLPEVQRDVAECRLCPRLVQWREQVAATPRASFAGESYWGRGVPGFGDPRAHLAIVGLAPAAHGANRTGRMFTGDRSGDFLYAALHRAGFASQPTSTSREDGLTLKGAYITAPCRCAPPENKPSPLELRRCAPFLDRELELLRSARVILALGAIAWRAAIDRVRDKGSPFRSPAPKFGHGAFAMLPDGTGHLLGSYHVSQQNTQTGRLTPKMFDEVLVRAVKLRSLGDE
jgi:uracil-DNA glycosylase family 4